MKQQNKVYRVVTAIDGHLLMLPFDTFGKAVKEVLRQCRIILPVKVWEDMNDCFKSKTVYQNAEKKTELTIDHQKETITGACSLNNQYLVRLFVD